MPRPLSFTIHRPQPPARQFLKAMGMEKGNTLGPGGTGKQERTMFLLGFWKASSREFRSLQDHLFLTSKQTKAARCPNYIC